MPSFLVLTLFSALFVAFVFSLSKIVHVDDFQQRISNRWERLKSDREETRRREVEQQKQKEAALVEQRFKAQQEEEHRLAEAQQANVTDTVVAEPPVDENILKQRFDSLCQVALRNYHRMPVSTPRAVDLGLSVLWADRNLGAKNSDESGYFFTRTGKQIEKTTKRYSEIDEAILAQPSLGMTAFDAAHMLLSHGWRLPTEEEMVELKTRCQWGQAQYNNKKEANVLIVTNNQDISLRIPLSGFMLKSSGFTKEGHATMFWLAENTPHNVFYIHPQNGMYQPQLRDFDIAMPIRPVKDR